MRENKEGGDRAEAALRSVATCPCISSSQSQLDVDELKLLLESLPQDDPVSKLEEKSLAGKTELDSAKT